MRISSSMWKKYFCLLALGAWVQASRAVNLPFGNYPPSLWYSVQEDVGYGPADDEKLDLILPHGRNKPALIYVHGGGWTGGKKTDYAFYAASYAEAGIAVININYRLAKAGQPSTLWPAQLQDAQLAVRWARANAETLGIDPARICAMGDSAGGHLVQFLGTLKKSRPGDRSALYEDQSPGVSCVVDMFGPSDFTEPTFRRIIGDRFLLFGGKSYAQDPQIYFDASPVLTVNSETAPMFIIQGLRDTIVPTVQAEILVEALKKNRIYLEYKTFYGDHWYYGVTDPSIKKDIESAAMHFVMRHLQP